MAQLTRPIVFLTDFGTRDHYVGQVKTVIAGIAPDAAVIDLTHEVSPYAIDEGAWLLETTIPLLPSDAVVLAVVDPGVGSSRRGIAVQSQGCTFVGPDNGLLSAAFSDAQRREDAGDSRVEVRELNDASWHRPTVSSTFHARDIFGPVAAHLARGEALGRCGSRVDSPTLLPPFEAVSDQSGGLRGRVIHIDRYGNVVTTIRATQLRAGCQLALRETVVSRRVRTFADAEPGVPFYHYDSSGYVAIAMREASAASILGATRGDTVLVHER